jgi:hypothetical protein
MLRAVRILLLGVIGSAMVGCASTFVDKYFPRPVRPEECAEIRIAIRKVTSAPVRDCTRPIDSQGRGPITVWTADDKTYEAQKVGAKWHFHEIIVVL